VAKVATRWGGMKCGVSGKSRSINVALDYRDDGIVTVWCVGSVNESLTVDAVAAAKGVRETSVLVRLAVYLEYYCCGDGDPVGQFRDTVGDGRSGAMSS
jgi:hypothetical protein